MTKWFDTNYHYMVPELARDQNFTLASRKPIEEYEEAKALGYQTRPVLVGPVTFLKLAKSKDAGFEPLSLLDRLLPVYIEVLRELADRGAEWVQIDEPCLVLDLDSAAQQALRHAYAEIARAVPQIKIMLATYFGALGRQPRHRVGAARRRPASRSRARARADRRPRQACRTTACCRSA